MCTKPWFFTINHLLCNHYKNIHLLIMNIIGIYRFYADGFKSMTTGRILWLIILLKLFVMFFIIKLFFFPSFLKDKTTEEKQDYVGNELVIRASDSYAK